MLSQAFLFISIAITRGKVAVETSFGTLLGSSSFLHGCEEWLGIPYAKPPINSLRFEDPVAWDEHFPAAGREATEYGASCLQKAGGDEDCLFLNVWRPANTTPSADLASMVYIHGGSFILGGSGSEAPGVVPGAFNLYNGCVLSSRHNVIVASMNYRLGPFGFAAFEDKTGNSANFGIKDQRQAFMWFKKELISFGGNPGKITIFGESAGAISVFYHLTSPLSNGLFRGAICESGFPFANQWTYAVNTTLKFGATMSCKIEATLKACLKYKDAKLLIHTSIEDADKVTWFPCIDGVDMPEHPAKMFKDGRSHAVPVFAGTNTNEGNLFVWPSYEFSMNESQYKDFVTSTWNGNNLPALDKTEVTEVSIKYPGDQAHFTGDRRAVAASLFTDAIFLCGTQFVGQYHASAASVFLYRFNHRPACAFPLTKFIPGVFHTIEMPYVWGDPWTVACFSEHKENELSKRMQMLWTNFAKNLNPSYQHPLPTYSNGSRAGIVLQTPADIIETNYRGDYCQLWQRVLYSKFVALPRMVSSPLHIIV